MKICTKKDCDEGGKPQPTSNYYKHEQGKDGLHPWCKKCILKDKKKKRVTPIGDWL